MKVSHVSLSLAGLALASSVHAAPEIEVGAEYQVNVLNTNDGLNEEAKQTKTTSFNLKGAKVIFRGKLSDQISWTVLYKAKESELERYYLTNRVTENLEVTIGKQKIKTYGLHRKLTSGVTTPVTGAYLDWNPLKDRVALDITYKLAGALSLQLVDDYSKCSDKTTYTNNPTTNAVTASTSSSCTSWNSGSSAGIVTNSKETQTSQKQPAVALEWYGNFGEFSPLLQYAVYDLGKSSTASAGLRYKTESMDAYFDYTMDTRNNKGLDPADPSNTKFIEEKNTYTGMVAYAEFKAGSYTPFVHLSTLATDPYSAPGATDAAVTALEANAGGKLDKNEMTVAVGTHFEQWGAFYRPFVDVTLSRGEFVDPSDATKKEDRSKTDLVAGLIGKF
ncbi:MAG TPA: hypothetical protein VFO10_19960 [Oligoflexus sp.]|uniref:hypothetical protein n=1 Tax=Oligoflexus sp. TaxID=1971216 RepID=UPI002D7FC3CF|nr:hypothetical protein [Oligoflexus sp.]HET9239547.1 hypothetical protein [Oligoflexus sp.]